MPVSQLADKLSQVALNNTISESKEVAANFRFHNFLTIITHTLSTTAPRPPRIRVALVALVVEREEVLAAAAAVVNALNFNTVALALIPLKCSLPCLVTTLVAEEEDLALLA